MPIALMHPGSPKITHFLTRGFPPDTDARNVQDPVGLKVFGGETSVQFKAWESDDRFGDFALFLTSLRMPGKSKEKSLKYGSL